MTQVYRNFSLFLIALMCGCSHSRSGPAPAQTRAAAPLEAYLATLRVGMTPKEAAPDLIRFVGLPIVGMGLHIRHQRAYWFSEGAVTLQFDERDQLVSWHKWEKVPAAKNHE